MAKRDPHDVLGVDAGASLATVKAAWRKLARQHHPDLTGDDPAASRVATRQMAEINDAYESLRREDEAQGGGRRSPRSAADAEAPPQPASRSGGPPRPRPSRPVTGRVDTTETFRPRNSTSGARTSLRGQMPGPNRGPDREPPRASQPNGPLERGRVHRFRPPPPPGLDAARDTELAFGKFRGHTLGEVAGFEPSYVDWLAKTITRDPELVAAARVIRNDLDRRGVVRRERPATAPGNRTA